ncbi:MAG: WxcM-like domain-containing protein [Candidatus Micrarchaeota archaeon]|nr:WxcM-like domain-containing protein [Candidatus Micrarchaeota archaeon]
METKNRLKDILIDIPTRSDARGEAVKIMTVAMTGWPTRDIVSLLTNPGVIRGNHYHKVKEEAFVVVTGRVLVKMVDVETGERKEITLDGKNRQLLFVHPYVAHTIKNIGDGPCWLVEMENADYDKNDDYRFEV